MANGAQLMSIRVLNIVDLARYYGSRSVPPSPNQKESPHISKQK
jgi:hypothetical protein